jgi:phospholipid N-methyltransferase
MKNNFTTFVLSAITNFKTTGAVAPSSRFLARAMVKPLRLTKSRVVVELGCGTGVMTQAMLERMPDDAKLLGFEINPEFSKLLKASISDSRFVLIDARAETLHAEVERRGFKHVDAVLSSLALGFFPDDLRRGILSEICHLIGDTGTFTQFQYVHSMQIIDGKLTRFKIASLLRQYFKSVDRKLVTVNIPPAFVYECRGPIHIETTSSRQFKN